MGEMHTAKIEWIRDETKEMKLLRVSGGPAELYEKFTVPGQYVQLSVGDAKPGYYAIASRPGEPYFEFLIKRGEGTSGLLTGLSAGDEVKIGEPMGKGYAIAMHKDKDLFLVATGSALAPIRSVVLTVLDAPGGMPEYGTVRVYLGVRSPDDVPFGEEIPEWQQGGIEIYRCYSRVTDELPGGETYNGYVQETLQALEQEADFAAACVCGQKEMMEAVKAILVGRGLIEEAFLTNY